MECTRIALALVFAAACCSTSCFAQFGGGDSGVGYIDSALVRNQVRFRFDASYDNPSPDRAEFLYPKCGCFGGDAPGPPLLETGIDFQEFSLYAESLCITDFVSGFVEVPFRLINPEQNRNTGGLSDINLGIKAALWEDAFKVITFQFRTYLPSGDGVDGLGTEHVSLEPALLFYRHLCNGTVVEGELRDFIPIDGSEGFAGNVLRYGIGISRTWIDDGRLSVIPVFETVAWSVLSGDVLKAGLPTQSAETTIVNVKLGIRVNLAPRCCSNDGTRSLYIGYGQALTGSRWYNDTIRAEYRLSF